MQRENEPTGTSGYGVAALHIANTILGAGIISLPVAIRHLGIVLGSISMVLLALCTIYSVILLIKALEVTKKSTYSSVAKASLGDVGYIVTLIMIIVNNFGVCSAYLRIFGETLQNTVQGFVSVDNFWARQNYIYIIIIFIVMGFVLFTDSFEAFKQISYIGIIGITIFTFSVIIIFFYRVARGLMPTFTSGMLAPSGDIIELITVFPACLLAFTFQFNLFPVYIILRDRTEIYKASNIGIIFCLIVYVIVGVLGYLLYGDQLTDTVLSMFFNDMKEFKDHDQFLKYFLVITNLSFLCCSTTGIPLTFFTLKTNCYNLITFIRKRNKGISNKKAKNSQVEMTMKDTPMSAAIGVPGSNPTEVTTQSEELDSTTTQPAINKMVFNPEIQSVNDMIIPKEEYDLSERGKVIVIVVVYFSIGALTIAVPQLKWIFHFVGATASNFLSFIIPNLMIIKLTISDRMDYNLWLPVVLLGCGFIFLITSVVSNILILVRK